MENKNRNSSNKGKDSSGFYHFIGLGLILSALMISQLFSISQTLKYAICAIGLIFMAYALFMQMSFIWRNANRETAERNKAYNAKVEAADAYLSGTKTTSE